MIKVQTTRFFAPIRPIIPGLLLLIVALTVSMGTGFYVMFRLNHPGDQTVLILLAGMVYPGPYVIFGIFGFFLFHARRSSALAAMYNAAVLLMIVTSLIINWPDTTQGRLSAQLHDSLFTSFLVTAGIGIVAIGLLLLFAQAVRPTEEIYKGEDTRE